MNLSSIKYAVTSKAGRQILKTRKASPKLLFGIGLVGFGATVVLAARATLQLDDVIDEHDIRMNTSFELNRRQQTKIYAGTVGRICKLYAPAVAVGSLSVACLTGSHVILTRRNVGLTAAYATIEKALNEYRARVVDEYGAEVDERLYQGGDIVTETKIDDKGKKVKTTGALGNGISGYSKVFGPDSSRYWKHAADYNKLYILAQQAHANDRLRLQGHLFLNEVYDMLGLDRTPEGQIVGWVVTDDEGDGYVTFGLDRPSAQVSDFMRGNCNTVVLDFNVDGPVYEKI